jgi:hypothetical protein
MKKIFEDSINNYSSPLEEEFYNSPNFEDYLPNEHFHHRCKGCEVKMEKNRVDDENVIINKICQTHNIKCSKTGWELGWYLGYSSRQFAPEKYQCQRCGCDCYSRRKTAKYCSVCRKLIAKDSAAVITKMVSERRVEERRKKELRKNFQNYQV